MKSAIQANKDQDVTAQEIILKQQAIIDKKSLVIQQQSVRILMLEEFLRLEKQKRFGPSSEKFPGQGELFNEVELASSADEQTAIGSEAPLATPQKTKPGRKGFSEKIAREQIFINLPDDEKVGAIDTFYSKVKEELDIVPAKVRILEYLQEKSCFC